MSVVGFITKSLIPHLVANTGMTAAYAAKTLAPFLIAHPLVIGIPAAVIGGGVYVFKKFFN